MKYLIILITLTAFVFPQKSVTLNGYVRDKSSGEALIGATVQIPEAKTGAKTNAYGFYSITVPAGTYNLKATYIGYKPFNKSVEIPANLKLDIDLETSSALTDEVVVTAREEDENIQSIEMSSVEISAETIKKIPALLGEVDVIKSIQLLPGVSTIGEGATGFNVRGGSIDQNLILLDEAPVYNSSHLFGFFSVFNPDAVKDIKLIKGGIPGEYGGRLSSILDIRLKEGNQRRFEAKGGIGAIFSRFSVEGPIWKDKISFIVAARRSYADVLAKPFLNKSLKNAQFYFYDLTAKANWKIDDRNTVFVSGYFGRDVFGANFTFNWGNRTGTARWNHLFSDKLFSNFTYYYSLYDYLIEVGDGKQDGFKLESGIQTQGLKYDFQLYSNKNNQFNFGIEGILYDFITGTAKGIAGGTAIDVSAEDRIGAQFSAYYDHEYNYGDFFTLKYGLRASYYANLGPYKVYEYSDTIPGLRKRVENFTVADDNEIIEDFINLEPRIAINYRIDEDKSVKMSYNRMAQYIHLMSNTAAATPLDLWTSSSNNLKPQLADQFAFGYFQNFDNNTWETSIETYYKILQNQVDYIDGANLTLNETLEADLLQGDGRTYGVELFVKKAKGKLNGWIGYTLARTERKIEGINNDDWFPARFDQTHKLNLTGIWEMTDKWTFSSNFVYQTGTPATFATNLMEFQGIQIPVTANKVRNGDRIFDYHRLDISFTYKPFTEPDAWWKGEWVFGIYNVYSHKNPFTIYPTTKKDSNGDAVLNENGSPIIEFVQLTIVGFPIPSITYNFDFDISNLLGDN